MRIACLVTVCAAFLSTSYIVETVHLERRRHSEDHHLLLKADNATAARDRIFASPFPGAPTISRQIEPNVYAGVNKKPRGFPLHRSLTSRRHALNRSKRGRRRRQLQRFGPRSLRIGRSYDVDENQIETIQGHEKFEEGAIHIEPLYRIVKKKNIVESLVDILRKVVDPPQHLGPLVGPVKFPGIGDKVYIRLLEQPEANHLVIRLLTDVPVPNVEPQFTANIPDPGLIGHTDVSSISHPSSLVSTETLSNPTFQHPKHPSNLLPSENLYVSNPNQLSSDDLHSSNSNLIPTGNLHSSTSDMSSDNLPASTGNLHSLSKPPSGTPNQFAIHNHQVKDTTRMSRTFKVASKHGSPRGTPLIAQSVNRPYWRPPGNTGFQKTVRHGGKNRQPIISTANGNGLFAGLHQKFPNKESKNQFLYANQYQDTSYYVYPTDRYQTEFRMPTETEQKNTTKIDDTVADGSLHPIYVTPADPTVQRQVHRNPEIPTDTGISNSYRGKDALEVINAPSWVPLQTSIVSSLPASYNVPREGINTLNNKMRYLTLNGTVETMDLGVSGANRYAGNAKSAEHGSVSQKVAIPANQYWESMRRSSLGSSEDEVSPDTWKSRNSTLINTNRNSKRNSKNFDQFPEKFNQSDNGTFTDGLDLVLQIIDKPTSGPLTKIAHPTVKIIATPLNVTVVKDTRSNANRNNKPENGTNTRTRESRTSSVTIVRNSVPKTKLIVDQPISTSTKKPDQSQPIEVLTTTIANDSPPNVKTIGKQENAGIPRSAAKPTNGSMKLTESTTVRNTRSHVNSKLENIQPIRRMDKFEIVTSKESKNDSAKTAGKSQGSKNKENVKNVIHNVHSVSKKDTKESTTQVAQQVIPRVTTQAPSKPTTLKAVLISPPNKPTLKSLYQRRQLDSMKKNSTITKRV